MSKKSLSEFTKLYSLSETLIFELRPVGKTEEMLEKSGLLNFDFERSEFYPKVKKILDGEHKALLNRVLSDIPVALAKVSAATKNKYKSILNDDLTDVNWLVLSGAKAAAVNKEEKAKKELENTEKSYRSLILELLKTDEMFDALTESTPAKWFKSFSGKHADFEKELKAFSSFATYFVGFQENRRNIYSAEAIATGAPNRAVNDNFTKFFKSVRIFKHLEKSYPELIQEAENELAPILKGNTLSQIFSVNAYGRFLSQDGISYINNLIGGYTCTDNVKVKGVNEFINLKRQNQKSNGAAKDTELVIMPLLFKQFLSDRESISYIPEQVENDDELCKMIQHFLCNSLENFESAGENKNVIAAIRTLLNTLTQEDNISIPTDCLESVSAGLTGSWNTIRYGLERYAEENFKTKKERESFLKKSDLSFSELNKIAIRKVDAEGNTIEYHVCDYWKGKVAEDIFAAIEMSRSAALTALDKKSEKTLHERTDDVADIKQHLDAIMSLLHFIKPLCSSENLNSEQAFTSEITALYQQLEAIVPLYSKVRNYLSKKNVEAPKIKLMFNKPTLGQWSADNVGKAVLLTKDEKFYLGIIHPKENIEFIKYSIPPCDNCYCKLEFNQYQKPERGLPTLIPIGDSVVRKTKGLEDLKERYYPESINRIRLSESFKAGKNFSKQDLSEYIEFYQMLISKYKQDTVYHFKNPHDYHSWLEFTKDVENQSYSFQFINVADSVVNDFIETGKLFLFQIYNKDFAPGAHGTPNKFTLYWKALFASDNLANITFALKGEGAELFLRNPVIKDPVVHQKGSKLVNRVTTDGEPIREDIYQQIYKFLNKNGAPLEGYAKELYDSGKVIVKEAKFDITKDRRYTQRKLSFHVPVSINYKAAASGNFNNRVLQYLADNPDVKIIGIDRGERHLLYLSLIDQQGNVLEQRSLNVVHQNKADYNYQKKLDAREKERDQARKSWSAIGQIKELKAGYLSAVVHEIAKMMVENNAIVVLEDLNFGFKRGRFKIEKQVYQNFEKALISKLNYLVFKQNEPMVPGGVLNGYQLTAPFESFEKLGKQSGFLFYVPAAYTSKIDPMTGFTNLFDLHDCTNATSRKAFLTKFDSICYNAEKDVFAFSFDYRNFKTFQKSWKNDWTVFSAKKRLVYMPTEKKTDDINPTQIIKNVLLEYHVTLSDGFDLLSYLKSMEPNTANAKLFEQILYAFQKTLQMRNSLPGTEEDYIESPVADKNGICFNSKNSPAGMPENADANGAYHIALKGLQMLQALSLDCTKVPNFDVAQYLEFVQKRRNG